MASLSIMFVLGINVLLAFVFSSLAEASSNEHLVASKGQVIVLNTTHFERYTSKGNWLVDFYAPWCSHCKKLAPVWDTTATSLQRDNVDVHLGKVDCTIEPSLCTNVNGYPSIKWYRDGIEVRDYTGPRVEAKFLEFSRRISNPSVEILSKSPFKRLEQLRNEGVLFVAVGRTTEEFKSAADLYIDRNFALIPDDSTYIAAANQHYGLQHRDIAVFNDVNGNKPTVYNEAEGPLDAWVNKHKLEVFPDLTIENYHSLLDAGKPLVISFDDQSPASKQLKENLREISIEDMAKGRDYVICSMNVNVKGHNRFMDELSLKKVPSFLVLKLKEELTYPYEGDSFATSDIKKFLEDFQAGKVSSVGMGGLGGFVRRNLFYIVGGLISLIVMVGFATYYFIEDDFKEDSEVEKDKKQEVTKDKKQE